MGRGFTGELDNPFIPDTALVCIAGDTAREEDIAIGETLATGLRAKTAGDAVRNGDDVTGELSDLEEVRE